MVNTITVDGYHWISPVARQMAERPEQFAALNALAPATIAGRGDAVRTALRASVTAFHLAAAKVVSTVITAPDELWLDDPRASR